MLITNYTLNIDYFAFVEEDANELMKNIKKLYPDNHIYVVQENMRYYVRGIILCTVDDQSYGYNQILQLGDDHNCCTDNHSELNYMMAG